MYQCLCFNIFLAHHKDNGQLAATNQTLQSNLQESAGLAERFAALENQYKAMSLVVLATPGNKDVTQVIFEFYEYQICHNKKYGRLK